jgi:hypothetical protein
VTQQCSATLYGDIDLIMMVADRSGRTGNEAGGGEYGKRLRVGLHFIQPNLHESPGKWHAGLVVFLRLFSISVCLS